MGDGVIPIIVEFTISHPPSREGSKDYFVGASIEDVLTDTKNGTEFGGT